MAPNGIAVAGTNIVLEIAGQRLIVGNVGFAKNAATKAIAVVVLSNASLTLGDGSTTFGHGHRHLSARC